VYKKSLIRHTESNHSKEKKYKCVCGKSYHHSQSLHTHKKRCSERKDQYEKKLEAIEAVHKKEKEEMRKQIESLLEKVGHSTTHIENQTNIHINYYGYENLEYVSDKFFQQMINIPYGSIPQIIKYIHFHPQHPENHNVKITNKKLPYASIFKNDKWELAHKTKVIEELMQKGYGLMDDKFLEVSLSEKGKIRFQDFQEKFQEEDKDVFKSIYQDTELCVLNGSGEIFGQEK
jgi:hypothetical protein